MVELAKSANREETTMIHRYVTCHSCEWSGEALHRDAHGTHQELWTCPNCGTTWNIDR